MAFKFIIDQQRFFTQYRNGDTFADNTGEYSDNIRGNVGDLTKMTEQITVEVIVNETESLTMTYDSSSGELSAPGINFLTEGLFISATVQVIRGEQDGESTVDNITGPGYGTLILDTTNLAFLEDGPHTNIVIRVKDEPTRSIYKYGLIRDDAPIDEDAFASPLDGNPQAYQEKTVSGSAESMERMGSFVSWDLSDSITIEYLGTTGDYYHQYKLIHVFRILPFKDGEQSNLLSLIKPDLYDGLHTVRYANSFSMGYSATIIGDFDNLGLIGDVGYFGEQYNGTSPIFEIDSIDFDNPLGTETIETSETTDFTAVITNTDTVFQAGQKVIVGHFACQPESSYSNSTETFDEAFVFETLTQTAGTGAVSGTIITDLEVTLDSSSQITVTGSLSFTSDQQAKLVEGRQFGLFFTVGDESASVSAERQVNLLSTGYYTKNDNISGYITGWSPSYYDAFSAYSGSRVFTNQACWDGDLIGVSGRFNLTQYNDGQKNVITKIESQVVLVKGTEKIILWNKPINYENYEYLDTATDYVYQFMTGSTVDSFRYPISEDLNVTTVDSSGPFAGSSQAVTIRSSIPRIPWREWVLNSDIPTEFFDATEPNNNLNEKTSNYSDVNSWEVYHQFYIEVSHYDIIPDPPPGGIQGTQRPVVAKYNLRSDKFEVLDFNVDGLASVSWSGEVKVYNSDDEEETNLLGGDRWVHCEFTHDEGTLSPQDIWGMIWIEKDGSTQEPWQLFTDRNWTNIFSPLAPSDTLETGNITLVELISELNSVTLICKINGGNLDDGSTYNIYGRAGKKT